MNRTVAKARPYLVGKLLAAVIIGLSASTAISRDPVGVPAVGDVSGALAGAIGFAVGVGLYASLRRSSDCGGSGDCGC